MQLHAFALSSHLLRRPSGGFPGASRFRPGHRWSPSRVVGNEDVRSDAITVKVLGVSEVSPSSGSDFLGAFAVLERADSILFVRNERILDGRPTMTWDLPGGRVESGELLIEALTRELREETQLIVRGTPRFLFVQEGQRFRGMQRRYTWRSFFFVVDAWEGEPAASNEIAEIAWLPRAELRAWLRAPYHDSFLEWLERPAPLLLSRWEEAGESET